ncbi:MAG TPA: squalene/phytoene synthase family protein [Verrucomicrobia bacterium]|nr:squalene/phytoene synthase family protein [Verrucomicrobiota bacterium]HOP97669.1 phytoene/squalene synthase family protein [Verrucomicrobiota bacterium]
MTGDRPQLPLDLLKNTSRSFYLTLRILPAPIRTPIGLAYLLARTTDTIADTAIVPVNQRLDLLQQLRERIQSDTAPPLALGDLAQHQGTPAERVLLEKNGVSLALLRQLHPHDRQRIREVLDTITSGQELDLKRFAGASEQHIVALNTAADLDDYTYRVAGCVGEFWTKTCRARLFEGLALDDAFLLTNGVRFGKGLQLVNILRDLPRDLRAGRCYLPLEDLQSAGLTPGDLLSEGNWPKAQRVYFDWLNKALSHLNAGWDYTNTLPWRHMRVRLACAWPLLIGFKTIDRLRSANPLDARQRIKITRSEVRSILLKSILLYPFPGAWRKSGHKAQAFAVTL